MIATRENQEKETKKGLKRTIGNGCAHDKYNLSLPLFAQITDERNKRPISIESAFNFIRKFCHWHVLPSSRKGAYLEKDRDFADALRAFECAILAHPTFRRLFRHDGEDGKRVGRKRRSERVESLVLHTLSTLFYFIDLRTMAIGRRNGLSHFSYADYHFISKKSGSSISRIKRSMSVLKYLGLVTVKKITKTLDDGYVITLRTEIHLSEEAFFMLGLKDQFLKDRAYIIKRDDTRIRKAEDKKKRMEVFRKPFAYQKKASKGFDKDIKSISDKFKSTTLTYNVPSQGKAIVDRIRELVNRGLTMEEAMKVVKQNYPPS